MDYEANLARIFERVKEKSIQSPDSNGNFLKWRFGKPADWDDLREKMTEDLYSAGPSPTHEDFFATVDRFLARLGTHHSGVIGAEPYYARWLYVPDVRSGGFDTEGPICQEPWPVLKTRRDRSDEMTNELTLTQSRRWSNDQLQPIFSLLADKQIAYLSLPGHFPGRDLPASIQYESTLRDGLMKASRSKKLKGAIVDLRDDWGGGCGPMLRGLSPLLGDEPLGYFINVNKQTAWTSDYGHSFHDSQSKPYAGNKSNYPLRDLPVVMLMGQNTGSSGEITALSLITRPNTVTIGSPSAGGTSANEGCGALLPELEAGCYFTTSISTDRTQKHGRGYAVSPDVLSRFPVHTAMKWMTNNLGIKADFAKLAGQVAGIRQRHDISHRNALKKFEA